MTNQEIINKAKTILEAEIEGIQDITWSSTSFLIWLKEAYLSIISQASQEKKRKEELKFLHKDFSASNITDKVTLPNDVVLDVVLLVQVKRNNYNCDIVKNLKDFGSFYFKGTETEPVCLKEGNILTFFPQTLAEIKVKYIKLPSVILEEESEFPLLWQNVVHFYIVAQALNQDKQEERATYYLKQFKSSLKLKWNEVSEIPSQ